MLTIIFCIAHYTYNPLRQLLFGSITHIIHVNFATKPDEEKLALMLHGTTLDGEMIYAVTQSV